MVYENTLSVLAARSTSSCTPGSPTGYDRGSTRWSGRYGGVERRTRRARQKAVERLHPRGEIAAVFAYSPGTVRVRVADGTFP